MKTFFPTTVKATLSHINICSCKNNNCIPGLSTESKELLEQYTESYEKDLFRDAMEAGSQLLK